MHFETFIQMLVLGRFDLTDRNNWLTIFFIALPYLRSTFNSINWSKYASWFSACTASTEKQEDERVIQIVYENDGVYYPSENLHLQRAVMFKVNQLVGEWENCDVELLRGQELLRLPSIGTWITIRDDLRFQINNDPSNTAPVRDHIIYKLRGRNLDTFLREALTDYNAHLEKKPDENRYLYMMTESNSNTRHFKKYVLSNDNTFETLHIPGKSGIMKLIRDFIKREGKFGIPGYPHKLGFLLHGPPGTGKTSFIKALSHHTKRHIVYISLEKVSTNQELLELVYERVYQVGHERKRMEFSDVIFVFEDIDASCDVVKIRDGYQEASDNKPGSKSLKSDDLNLCGILNMLDGLLDSPERIVVMTTNHPEMLDPALIRPGRVNMQLHLDYIRPAEAEDMVKQYFPSATSFREKDFDVFRHSDISPAALEALCAQYEDPSMLLGTLTA